MKDYNILIVEDEVIQYEILKNTIAKLTEKYPSLKINIDSAGSFKNAVDRIKARVYDLYILDIVLPDFDGFSVAAFIRAYVANNNLPSPKVIFISGLEENKEEILRLVNVINAHIIWKPLDIHLFQTVVSDMLDLKNLSAADISELPNSVVKGVILHELDHYLSHLIMIIRFLRNSEMPLPTIKENEIFLEEMDEHTRKAEQYLLQLRSEFTY